ncbi:uncharacterized protein LOC127621062 isoform X2 [Xyrauchen texanus]|uniref:uncharacterized protein LOC127621062 isoform X2 n=1 Tax=Xyrauchen texanus TaxID=154827 RepID=UPI002241FE92|nr:uncharacterized protein LOC127621062 isoform X2 [Xyrauchen texanus]
MNTDCLLFLLCGVSMFPFISCYSDGSLLEDQCQEMNIIHSDGSDEIPAQNTEAPFNITPEVQTFNYSQMGSTITVSLTAINSVSFIGFMLDARKCDSCPPAGTFSLVDLSSTLLICNSRAVSHTNNLDKTSITVKWVVPENGTFYFRGAFTKDFFTFWRRKPIILPTTAPTSVATTIKSTSSQTVPTTLPPTSNTNSAPVPSTLPPQCMDYVRYVLALSLVSRLCFLDSSLLVIFRPVLKMVTMICSVFELAFKMIAVIIVLIRSIQYVCVCDCAGLEDAFPTLTVIAMVTSLLHTITVFLHCGPSHELRKYWLCSIIIVDLLNTCITTAIFVGLRCFQEHWLLILMVVFVIWEIILYFSSLCCDKMEKYQIRNGREIHNQILEKRISTWILVFIIFSVLSLMFTIALITGVFSERMITF